MKKILLIFGIIIIMQGCSKTKYQSPQLETEANTGFTKENKIYGKAIAAQIRNIVTNLHNDGYDYSILKNKSNAKEQFYKDVLAVSPEINTANSPKVTSIDINPAILEQRMNELTSVQLAFIEKINLKFKNSKSNAQFINELLIVNREIQENVPEIQKERLLNFTAMLYYGLNELMLLEKEGQFVNGGITNKIQGPRLKASVEDSDGGGSGGSCRELVNQVEAFIYATAASTGEVVTQVTTKTVTVSGSLVMMFVGILCLKGDNSSATYHQRMCDNYRDRCVDQNLNKPYPQRMECNNCWTRCRNGEPWPYSVCPVQ